jgi:hypothetical protein
VFEGIVDHIRCLSILGGAGMGSRVELFAAIRWDYQREGLGVRALARKYDVHRRTVRQAIGSPLPPDRKRPVREAPVREAERKAFHGIPPDMPACDPADRDPANDTF